MPRLWLVPLFALAALPAARADVKVHPIFSDNMVLQRDTEAVFWGTADDGEDVTVEMTNGKTVVMAEGKAKGGKWAVKLGLKAWTPGTGYTVTVKGKNTVTFKNVAVGDVWLCSGQSNMEWNVKDLNKDDKAKGVTKDQGKTVAAKAANKNIRLYTVRNTVALEPQASVPVGGSDGTWLECDEKTVMNFSAVGYFFGRDIEASQKVPVGLIASDWGGTPCEAWASKEALEGVTELKYYPDSVAEWKKNVDENFKKATDAHKEALAKWEEAAKKAKDEGKTPPPAPKAPVKQDSPKGSHTPSALYNGMIAPIVNFKIKGALWYQGETNADRAAEYYTLFPTMISDWRKRWGYDFPFFVVQLAPYRDNGSDKARYAEVRDAQFQASKKLKNVGYATLADIGNETDIHPQAKEPVGQRLALSARAIAYGEKIEWSGPVYKGMKADGGKVTLTFDHTGKGLEAKGDKLEGFMIAGEDKTFVPAEAKIVGETVEVTAKGVDKPTAVRYAWQNFPKPDPTLGNKDGLPAVPFRTDDFPLTTLKK